jgi:hypothetical protein
VVVDEGVRCDFVLSAMTPRCNVLGGGLIFLPLLAAAVALHDDVWSVNVG